MPAPLVVGLGAACDLASREMQADSEHIRKLAHRLYDGIHAKLQHVVLNGPGHLDEKQRYVGNLNMSFAYVEGESLLMGLKVRTAVCRSCWSSAVCHQAACGKRMCGRVVALTFLPGQRCTAACTPARLRHCPGSIHAIAPLLLESLAEGCMQSSWLSNGGHRCALRLK